MIKFENEFIEIIYDEELKVLSFVYKVQPQSDKFMELNQKFLDEFKTLDCNKILINAIEIKLVSVENQNWVANTMIPEMLKHINGRKLYHAQILNSDAFVQFAAHNIQKKSMKKDEGSPMEINAFEKVEDGINWLSQQA